MRLSSSTHRTRRGGAKRSAVLVLSMLAALVAVAQPAGAQETAVLCAGQEATIVGTTPGTINGTDGDDVIVGTSGADTINAGAGNDSVCGLGGGDLIRGGTGRDIILGGNGPDALAPEQKPNPAAQRGQHDGPAQEHGA